MSLQAVLDNLYQGRTLVVGHRGANAYAPMNTLEAFRMAVDLGADGIELDVHRSKDGHVVVLHDFTLDATTNGTGLVTDKTLAELKKLDAGSWFSSSFARARIPTLDEVFQTIIKQNFCINIEIKSISVETDGVEQAVAQCIEAHNMKARVIVSSFNPLVLIRFRQIMPDVALGYLYAPDFPTMPFDIVHPLTYEATHPFHEVVNFKYMDNAREKGYRVNTWTVNDPKRAVELRDLGVDMIITDRPDVIRDALDN